MAAYRTVALINHQFDEMKMVRRKKECHECPQTMRCCICVPHTKNTAFAYPTIQRECCFQTWTSIRQFKTDVLRVHPQYYCSTFGELLISSERLACVHAVLDFFRIFLHCFMFIRADVGIFSCLLSKFE